MPPEAVDAQAAEARFTLNRLVVHRAIFEQIDFAPREEGERRPATLPESIQVTANINLNADAPQAMVTLEVRVLPDLKWQPYRIEVVISGIFTGEGVSSDQFLQFCKFSVPPILFPYVRETVHRMTMDGVGGPVRLNPINIQELVNRNPWSEEDSTASNEPQPPSSQ